MPAPTPAPAPPAAPPAASDAAWAAVLARDPGAAFVYAVRTTGVYCRPRCPSRRPRREHVAVYDAPADARAAGFRACRRCAPDAAAPAPTRADAAVARARALLDAAAADPAGPARLPLAELARAAGMSAAHLQRAFTAAVGASPARYAAALRAGRLRLALRGERTVSRAVYAAGYAAPSRAYAAAEAHLGMTPAAYARGGAGVRLWWGTASVAVGRALVAATARGVCAAFLGDDDAALAAALAAEFPRAECWPAAADGPAPDGATDDGVGDDAAAARAHLADGLAAVARAAEGRPAAAPAPTLDTPATAWQARVWDALRAIPPGETRTYGALAAALGRPGAARAVATACAGNRVALVVPCHRVVPAGGGAGGYRWHPSRKARLLAAERGAAPTADAPAPA
jgi:AraC family transcriptional regulator of adaptative response/methylated-DNA-[protein]-cysteine methyltransferase